MASFVYIPNYLVHDIKRLFSNGYRTPLLIPVLLTVYLALTSMNGMTENTIDFSKSTNLKAVYDAGLRPWRIRPDERSTLLVTNQQVRLVAPGTTPFTLDVEIGNFDVHAGNELGEAEFSSQPTSLTQATVKAREVCEALGIPLNGFQEKATQLATLGDQTPVPQYWNGRGERSGIRFSVTLVSLFAWEEPRGKISVVFQFSQPGKTLDALTDPIRPPLGYEHVSMEPPETLPDKPFPDPAYSRESVAKRLEANGSDNQSPRPSTPAAADAHAVQGRQPGWDWSWMLAILALVVLVAVALKRRG